jgi:hypothetical protein
MSTRLPLLCLFVCTITPSDLDSPKRQNANPSSNAQQQQTVHSSKDCNAGNPVNCPPVNPEQKQYDPYFDHLYRAYLLATIIGSGVALVGIAFLFVQTTLTKAAAIAAKNSADSARESAAISRLSMIASDRAYVHQNGFKHISHFDKKIDNIFGAYTLFG